MRTLSLPIVVFALVPWVAQGAIVTVTTSIDEDDGVSGGGTGVSLREAVNYSTTGDTLTFASGLSGGTIRLVRGVLNINKSLTIDASALPSGIAISGDKAGNGPTADDTRIVAVNGGTFLFHSVNFIGGRNNENGGALICHSTATAILDRCTLSGNSGLNGGAIFVTGGHLTLRNSTVSGNLATSSGGGVYLSGGTFIAENSTFGGNAAQASGGGIAATYGTLTLKNGTISANSAGSDGGGISTSATCSIQNTIVAGNAAPTGANISGSFSGSYNLTSGNPRLAPLGNYGGPTQTMPPIPGSPAMGAASWPPAFAADQRGFPLLDKPEIGSVEFQNSDHARIWNMDFDGDGSPFGIEHALGTDNFVPDSGNIRNLSAPVFDSSGHVTLRFGRAGSVAGTQWVIKRSPDLNPENFREIYRYRSVTETMAPGISCERSASSFILTDSDPSAGSGFYRFEAVFDP